MKPPPFEYHRPDDVDGALELLAEHGDDGKVLAGGQSLVALLNFRLAEPAHLIDLNGIGELAHVRRTDGALRIGTMSRQSVLEQSPVAASHWPILPGALRLVAHPQIRNRGTVGGSAAHADPAAELPIAFAALEARFHTRSRAGARTIPWSEFFVTHLTTALEPDEMLVEIEVPPLPADTGWAFTEFSRRHGDFALGGAAVLLSIPNGTCADARIALLGASDVPLRAGAAERALVGGAIDEEAAAEAGRQAVAEIEPTGDIHGSSEYRVKLIEAMVRRGVLEAAGRAGKGKDGS